MDPPLFDALANLPGAYFDDSCSQATDVLLVVNVDKLSDGQFRNYMRGRLYQVETMGTNNAAAARIRAFLER